MHVLQRVCKFGSKCKMYDYSVVYFGILHIQKFKKNVLMYSIEV